MPKNPTILPGDDAYRAIVAQIKSASPVSGGIVERLGAATLTNCGRQAHGHDAMPVTLTGPEAATLTALILSLWVAATFGGGALPGHAPDEPEAKGDQTEES